MRFFLNEKTTYLNYETCLFACIEKILTSEGAQVYPGDFNDIYMGLSSQVKYERISGYGYLSRKIIAETFSKELIHMLIM